MFQFFEVHCFMLFYVLLPGFVHLNFWFTLFESVLIRFLLVKDLIISH